MTRIVSIHSYRGGTGKSNLTANLATSMALLGQRVGIIDTDIQSPGIHFLFGLNGDTIHHTLNDYLWGKCDIKDAAHDVSAVLEGKSAGSIYLIPSSMKIEEIATVLSDGYDVDLLQQGYDTLNEELALDYLLIDTHPGLNEETLFSIGLSDILLIILRPDRQDYQGTGVMIQVGRQLDVPKMLLVVNKALPDIDLNAFKQKIAETYNKPVAGILPLSTDMLRLGSEGLFCVRYPDHPLTVQFNQIVSHIQAD